MARSQKVITPDNLGQGIAYNPQTKKWEARFVSEAEIEQVTNYVEPQEDDEHYVAKEYVKLRDRASGYMWDSCKSTLKDRAPGVSDDEKQAINKALKEEAAPINIHVKVTDKETGADVMAFTQAPPTYRKSYGFITDSSFRAYMVGEHPAVKLTVSADPITIKWWSGKVTLNFKPYDVYFKANHSLGSFEA